MICSRGEIDFSSEGWSAVSPAAVDLVKQMVDKDPAKRPTVEGVGEESSGDCGSGEG